LEFVNMRRARAVVLAVGILAGGCAQKTAPPPAGEPVPYTDQELADALVREGVGVRGNARAPRSPDEPLPTEIRQTPRGVVITFRDLLFAFDSADLTPDARGQIERMAFVMNHPQALARRIALEGHTDAIGTDAYNLTLSRRRAESVAQELVARGVRRDRVSVEAFGKRTPIASNTLPDGSDNPAGRALNRRVEAIVHQPSSPR
jgi:outer membrane protein OmpA-like peptidoglycan-associated protein